MTRSNRSKDCSLILSLGFKPKFGSRFTTGVATGFGVGVATGFGVGVATGFGVGVGLNAAFAASTDLVSILADGLPCVGRLVFCAA